MTSFKTLKITQYSFQILTFFVLSKRCLKNKNKKEYDGSQKYTKAHTYFSFPLLGLKNGAEQVHCIKIYILKNWSK